MEGGEYGILKESHLIVFTKNKSLDKTREIDLF